ncbi:NAD(P)H-binding protein [Nodosilinea sp. E11]|uniref:NAD(P)H-binding protein n=1 Tax=Nodosilinea sp. E11 TaxID=3037479 RepID=UPI00293460DF|nr:NAD(P)H-binding protein [Nodosilinea sp. E11]WOD36919.1 NAD(P)H-binding protein [Nodosilinea sp. E11]
MMFVTGAGGNVGRAIVADLQQRGMAYRIGARTGRDQPHMVPFDFLKPETFGAAIADCKALFLLRPPAVANTKATLNPFIDVARKAGVEQIVFISVAGAADKPWVPHYAVEQHLKAGPLGWTILRPGFFAQNLGDAYRDDIVHDHRIYVPAAQGRVAFIDARDIAAVAVAAFRDPATHAGQSYTLTGPEAVTFDQVATMLSAELGRPIRVEAASLLSYVRHLKRRGLPWMQILVQTLLHRGLRMGEAEAVTDTVPTLLGRPACSLAEYIHDHRELWAA